MSALSAQARAGALAVLVLSIMVSACSLTGSGTPAGLPPAGGEIAVQRPARAAESREVVVTAGGPPVQLPSGLQLRIEDPPGGPTDPVAKAVLDDSAMLFAAMYQAIDRGDPDDALYQRYATRGARSALRDVIAVFASNDWTATGTATVYRRTAEVTTDADASVAWCADLRTVLPMEIASGHVLTSQPGNQGYLRYEGTMRRSSSGLWVMTSLQSQRADPACL